MCLIGQNFDCGLPVNHKCGIKFDYKLPPPAVPGAPRTQAKVFLTGPAGVLAAVLPRAPNYLTVKIKYPKCGPLNILFIIKQKPAGFFIPATFEMDNIEATCGGQFDNIDELPLVPAGEVPDLAKTMLDIDGVVGSEVPLADKPPVLNEHEKNTSR